MLSRMLTLSLKPETLSSMQSFVFFWWFPFNNLILYSCFPFSPSFVWETILKYLNSSGFAIDYFYSTVVKKWSLSKFCFYKLMEIFFVASIKLALLGKKKSLFYLHFILLSLQHLRRPIRASYLDLLQERRIIVLFKIMVDLLCQ